MLRLSNSPISIEYNAFWYFILLQIFMTILQAMNLGSVAAILWVICGPQCLHVNAEYRTRNLRLLGSLLCLVGKAEMIPFLSLMVIGIEQHVIFTPLVREKIIDAEIWVEKTMAGPVLQAGANNALVGELQICSETLLTWWKEWTESTGAKYGFAVHAVKLRENGLSNRIEDEDDTGIMTPGEVIHKETDAVTLTKTMGIVVSLLLCFLFRTGTLGFSMLLITMMIISWDSAKEKYALVAATSMVIPDGVYRLTRTFIAMPIDHCIGVGYEGVMHAPYHGVAKGILVLGKTIIKPYFISIHADITTWGGMPHLTRPDHGEEIYVYSENEANRGTYRTKAIVDFDGSFSWISKTEPGESGSPIWKKVGDDLVLLGLAGRWASQDGVKSEVSVKPELVADDVRVKPGEVTNITMHPGAGKTWRIIPKLVRDFLVRKHKGRVMVVGPTRVVAKEIYGSLKKSWRGNVGLNIKGMSQYRNALGMVQVTTHHSFMNMIHRGARETCNLGLLIIDEAHIPDTATRLCNLYAESAAKNGLSCVRMSATLDGNYDKGSNFPIVDQKIKEGKEYEMVKKKVEEGKRVIWFVPTALKDGGCKDLARKLTNDGIPSIGLSRETYEQCADSLNDKKI